MIISPMEAANSVTLSQKKCLHYLCGTAIANRTAKAATRTASFGLCPDLWSLGCTDSGFPVQLRIKIFLDKKKAAIIRIRDI